MSTKLLIGIVAYRSGDSLTRCLDSLVNIDHGIDIAVSVVDNAPEAEDAAAVENRHPEVFVQRADNPGYGGGMNRAFNATPSEHFLILNPDTVVSPGSLQKLVARLEESDDVGAVGPKLVYPNGTTHPTARKDPSLFLTFLECLDLNVRFPNNGWLKDAGYHDADPTELEQIDWITGAALVVSSELFLEIGGFDETYFMYSEETDLQKRIRNLGYRVEVVGDAQFTHEHAHTTRRTDVRQVEFYKSLWLFIRKHRGFLAGAFVRFLLILRCLLLGTAVTLRYLLNRAERRERLSPLKRLLSWCLGGEKRTHTQTPLLPAGTTA